MAAEPLPKAAPQPSATTEQSGLARIWSDILAAGWDEALLRYASHALLLLVLAGAIGVRRWDAGPALDWLQVRVALYPSGATAPAQATATSEAGANATAVADETGGPEAEQPALLPPASEPTPTPGSVIWRWAEPHTLIPTRARVEVITYTVQPGDTLFGIAERYNLQPETVLWGNYFALQDDPHSLKPGQTLNILPVDGTYHFVTEDNTLEKVASFYRVEPQVILDWAGNGLDPDNPVLVPGAYLVVPGGRRELQSWAVPTIRRQERASAANNFGQCPGGYSGAVGTGSFVWPADSRTLSGYDFSVVHRGLDIRARLGDPLYAADSGVVVYAGPNDFGYGNLIVIDHGNGWQTVYAHLSQWNVVCGESVFQGNLIGLAGSTGRSSGPHLHFEVRYNGAYINPWTVLP